jgi:hypothetical protein
MRFAPASCISWPIGAAVFVLALGAAANPAHAQGTSIRTLCTDPGPHLNEPMPGREEQSILEGSGTCVIQGGPMDGAVETQHKLWHFDKAGGSLVSLHAVARKPGSMAVYVNDAGTLDFRTTEGKVTGWTASGKGRYVLGTGAAAAFSGKSVSWTAVPTGPRTYIVSVVIEP